VDHDVAFLEETDELRRGVRGRIQDVVDGDIGGAEVLGVGLEVDLVVSSGRDARVPASEDSSSMMLGELLIDLRRLLVLLGLRVGEDRA
jgi:hypothetical protein